MSAATADALDPKDIRPIVPTSAGGSLGMWVFGGVLLLGGFMLFNALQASEEASEVPSALAPREQGGRIASPPPLQTPDRFSERDIVDLAPATFAEEATTIVRQAPVVVPQFSPTPLTLPTFETPPRSLPELAPAPPRASVQPEVIFEAASRPIGARSSTGSGRASDENDRVSAQRLANPSRTVPQGTVIPAVLETALDSTRAGGVRALVQRDVSSFDGSRVLIPRGSRLYGEYEANIQSGQNRALVKWTRLIRPDGVTVALDSPSSDPLGRAGIRGRVDSKFLQRFGGALLQSVLDIGVGVAVREASDGVIVALPGSTQNVQVTDQQSIQPTLKVRHGTSVSVFVARDLDFSSVDP